MSKLKEIIHQYVVEALEEILDEEVEQIDEGGMQRLNRLERAAKKNPDNKNLKKTVRNTFLRVDTNRMNRMFSSGKLGPKTPRQLATEPQWGQDPRPFRSEEVEQISEARKLLKTYNSPIAGIGAKVYRNPETGEHQVDFYKNGKNLGEGPRYYTDDREDAHDTAQAEIKHMEKIETALQKMRDNLAKRAPQTDKYDD